MFAIYRPIARNDKHYPATVYLKLGSCFIFRLFRIFQNKKYVCNSSNIKIFSNKKSPVKTELNILIFFKKKNSPKAVLFNLPYFMKVYNYREEEHHEFPSCRSSIPLVYSFVANVLLPKHI